MNSREKQDRDDFQLPHKNRIKILKREMKAALRSVPLSTCRVVPHSVHSTSLPKTLTTRSTTANCNTPFIQSESRSRMVGQGQSPLLPQIGPR